MTLAILVHFSDQKEIPYSIRMLIEELSAYCGEVILVTNERELTPASFQIKGMAQLIQVENEGYDFGKFYKVLSIVNLKLYSRLLLVNDSNLLLGSLDDFFQWSEGNDLDVKGMIDSFEKPWFSTHSDAYHLQSFFLLLEQRAIDKLQEYLLGIDVEGIFAEKDLKELRRKVINVWEIGLSQFFLSQELKLGARFSTAELSADLGLSKKINLTIKADQFLLKQGYPFLKKRLIAKPKFFKKLFQGKSYWEKRISAHLHPKWNRKQLLQEIESIRS